MRAIRKNHKTTFSSRCRQAAKKLGKAAVTAFSAYRLLLPASAHAKEAEQADTSVEIDHDKDSVRASNLAPFDRDVLVDWRLGIYMLTDTFLESPSGSDAEQLPSHGGFAMDLYVRLLRTSNLSLGPVVGWSTNGSSNEVFDWTHGNEQYRLTMLDDYTVAGGPRANARLGPIFVFAQGKAGAKIARTAYSRVEDADAIITDEQEASKDPAFFWSGKAGILYPRYLVVTAEASNHLFRKLSGDLAFRIPGLQMPSSVIPIEFGAHLDMSRLLIQDQSNPDAIVQNGSRLLIQGEADIWLLTIAPKDVSLGMHVGYMRDNRGLKPSDKLYLPPGPIFGFVVNLWSSINLHLDYVPGIARMNVSYNPNASTVVNISGLGLPGSANRTESTTLNIAFIH